MLARVFLAAGRDVGMAEDAPLGNVVAGADVVAERDDGRYLGVGIGRQTAVVAGVDDLDADGDGVDVALAGPEGLSRVPGAAALGDELGDPAAFPDEIMGGHLGGRVAQPFERRLAGRHARVMKNKRVDIDAFALAVVRRGVGVRDERTIRLQYP